MKALIRDNIVMDLAENEFTVHSDYVWMDNPPDDCKAGWTLIDGVFTAPPEPPEPTYDDKRRKAYPSVGDQLDMIYKDMKNSTTAHADAIEAIKAKYPKP